jgi:MFS family permease
MRKTRGFLQNYHPLVYTLLAGTVITVLARSMSIPFLAIYLSSRTGLAAVMIGLIIGSGSIAGMFGGFIGGTMSDYFGRKKIMVISLAANAFVFSLYTLTTDTVLLFILSIVGGIAASFFEPASKALIADISPAEQRLRIFSMRYMAINLGFAFGPPIGAFLGLAGGVLPFFITAGVYFLYGIGLTLLLRKFSPAKNSSDVKDKISISAAGKVLRSDMALLFLIIGGTLSITANGEMSVCLSQYLKENFTEGIKLFSILMSVNAVSVFIFQTFQLKLADKLSPLAAITFGSLLFAAGLAGFAISSSWVSFIFSMIIFTAGEVLVVPAEYVLLDRITPEGMRGTYYGAQSFTNLGNFLGPWAGGLLLSHYGGPLMFGVMSVLTMISIYFYRRGAALSQGKHPVLISAHFAD